MYSLRNYALTRQISSSNYHAKSWHVRRRQPRQFSSIAILVGRSHPGRYSMLRQICLAPKWDMKHWRTQSISTGAKRSVLWPQYAKKRVRPDLCSDTAGRLTSHDAPEIPPHSDSAPRCWRLGSLISGEYPKYFRLELRLPFHLKF